MYLGTPLKGRFDPDFPTQLRVGINQCFGENANGFYAQLHLNGHNGIDFSTTHYVNGNAPVLAAHDGYVVSDASVQSDTKGRYVEILSDEMVIDGKKCKIKTMYFHLKEAYVSTTPISTSWWAKWLPKNGTRVKRGQMIGIANNTGLYTTGAHLHFGLYILWKQANGGYVKDTQNGYDGAEDPMPYFNGREVFYSGSTPSSRKYWFKGEEITKEEAERIKNDSKF